MKTATIDDVIGWEPCEKYTREKVTELYAGKETITAIDMLELDIPADDKFWAVLREELINASVMHEFACRCAERALSRIDNPDPRSIAAIAAKRAWLRGEITDEELSVAKDAAVSVAASAAASAAAYAVASAAAYAAWAAARYVARGAARYAARGAARDAAGSAAREAAWEAERKWQVEMLIEMLRGQE